MSRKLERSCLSFAEGTAAEGEGRREPGGEGYSEWRRTFVADNQVEQQRRQHLSKPANCNPAGRVRSKSQHTERTYMTGRDKIEVKVREHWENGSKATEYTQAGESEFESANKSAGTIERVQGQQTPANRNEAMWVVATAGCHMLKTPSQITAVEYPPGLQTNTKLDTHPQSVTASECSTCMQERVQTNQSSVLKMKMQKSHVKYTHPPWCSHMPQRENLTEMRKKEMHGINKTHPHYSRGHLQEQIHTAVFTRQGPATTYHQQGRHLGDWQPDLGKTDRQSTCGQSQRQTSERGVIRESNSKGWKHTIRITVRAQAQSVVIVRENATEEEETTVRQKLVGNNALTVRKGIRNAGQAKLNEDHANSQRREWLSASAVTKDSKQVRDRACVRLQVANPYASDTTESERAESEERGRTTARRRGQAAVHDRGHESETESTRQKAYRSRTRTAIHAQHPGWRDKLVAPKQQKEWCSGNNAQARLLWPNWEKEEQPRQTDNNNANEHKEQTKSALRWEPRRGKKNSDGHVQYLDPFASDNIALNIGIAHPPQANKNLTTGLTSNKPAFTRHQKSVLTKHMETVSLAAPVSPMMPDRQRKKASLAPARTLAECREGGELRNDELDTKTV